MLLGYLQELLSRDFLRHFHELISPEIPENFQEIFLEVPLKVLPDIPPRTASKNVLGFI